MSTVRIVTGKPLHSDNRVAIGFELLVLAGQVAAAVHEQEFAAEQAYAHGARRQGAGSVARQLDVGEQFHRLAVERDGRRVPQPVKPSALEFALTLPKPILLEHDRTTG